MTTYPDWQWDCPMCDLSILISDDVLLKLGESAADQHLDYYVETHINGHCTEFADQLAVSTL